MGGGGFVTGIITSKSEPGLVYARTDVGGAYRWDSEAGEAGEWIPLNNWVSAEELRFLGIESLAIDESSPNKVYMLAGTFYWTGDRTAILRSDDYGATFEVVDVSEQFRVHGNGNGRQTGERLQVDPNNGDILYSGSRWTGLFKSVDAGKTWARLSGLDVTTTPNDNGVHLVVIDPTSASNGTSQTLFVGVSRYGDNFYRSDDAGATFTPVAGAPTDLIPQHAVLHSDGNLYLAYANGVGTGGHANASLNEPMDRGQIWKYSPDAGTWTNLTPANVTSAFGGISVDPSNPQRMIVSTMNTWMAQGSAWGDRILLSNDGGANWTDLIARGFDVDPDGTQLRRRREFLRRRLLAKRRFQAANGRSRQGRAPLGSRQLARPATVDGWWLDLPIDCRRDLLRGSRRRRCGSGCRLLDGLHLGHRQRTTRTLPFDRRRSQLDPRQR